MITTEEEALGMVCPMSKEPGLACFGSKCMAWVWVKWKQVNGEREFAQDTDQCLVKPYKGKCGMVGGTNE